MIQIFVAMLGEFVPERLDSRVAVFTLSTDFRDSSLRPVGYPRSAASLQH